jgi:hypothetical protein
VQDTALFRLNVRYVRPNAKLPIFVMLRELSVNRTAKHLVALGGFASSKGVLATQPVMQMALQIILCQDHARSLAVFPVEQSYDSFDRRAEPA